MMATHLLSGKQAESFAENYLTNQGLKFIGKNYRAKTGEIDLIMLDGDNYVFIEVRFRDKQSHGGGLESVTRSKQLKIVRTAQIYLQEKQLLDKVPCRFDVIALDGESQIEWVKAAFDLSVI